MGKHEDRKPIWKLVVAVALAIFVALQPAVYEFVSHFGPSWMEHMVDRQGIHISWFLLSLIVVIAALGFLLSYIDERVYR